MQFRVPVTHPSRSESVFLPSRSALFTRPSTILSLFPGPPIPHSPNSLSFVSSPASPISSPSPTTESLDLSMRAQALARLAASRTGAKSLQPLQQDFKTSVSIAVLSEKNADWTAAAAAWTRAMDVLDRLLSCASKSPLLSISSVSGKRVTLLADRVQSDNDPSFVAANNSSDTSAGNIESGVLDDATETIFRVASVVLDGWTDGIPTVLNGASLAYYALGLSSASPTGGSSGSSGGSGTSPSSSSSSSSAPLSPTSSMLSPSRTSAMSNALAFALEYLLFVSPFPAYSASLFQFLIPGGLDQEWVDVARACVSPAILDAIEKTVFNVCESNGLVLKPGFHGGASLSAAHMNISLILSSVPATPATPIPSSPSSPFAISLTVPSGRSISSPPASPNAHPHPFSTSSLSTTTTGGSAANGPFPSALLLALVHARHALYASCYSYPFSTRNSYPVYSFPYSSASQADRSASGAGKQFNDLRYRASLGCVLSPTAFEIARSTTGYQKQQSAPVISEEDLYCIIACSVQCTTCILSLLKLSPGPGPAPVSPLSASSSLLSSSSSPSSQPSWLSIEEERDLVFESWVHIHRVLRLLNHVPLNDPAFASAADRGRQDPFAWIAAGASPVISQHLKTRLGKESEALVCYLAGMVCRSMSRLHPSEMADWAQRAVLWLERAILICRSAVAAPSSTASTTTCSSDGTAGAAIGPSSIREVAAMCGVMVGVARGECVLLAYSPKGP
eukprot:ANDGO_02135.mRNA.1 hypothetical protein